MIRTICRRNPWPRTSNTNRSSSCRTAMLCTVFTVVPAWQRFAEHGFVTLPGDIGRAVLLGLLISGLLGALVPANFFADRIGQGLLSMLLMMGVGIPFYVCSTASIPIAFSLIHAGISPGGALVFLIAGPATNAATFTTLWTVIGRRATGVYLVAIAACAVGSGLALDMLLPGAEIGHQMAHHEHGIPAWKHVAAVGLLMLLLWHMVPKRQKKAQPA